MKKYFRNNAAYYIKSAAGILVMIAFAAIPPFGSITPLGMRILGIYIGTILLWALVDMIWPSLLGIILVSMTGYMRFDEYISSGFGNTTVIFVFLISIFAGFITSSGVSDNIARYVVSRKIAHGKPWLVSSLFVFASYLIACLISSVAATLVVLEFFSQFAKRAGYKRGEKYPTLMMVCITFAAHMGGSVWTFRTPDAILVGYIKAQGGSVPLIPYFLCSVFIGGGALVLYMLYCKLFSKADTTPLVNCCAEIETVPMTPYQRRLLTCSLVLLALLIMESMLPSGSGIGSLLSMIGTNGIVTAMLAAMMFFRLKDGGSLADIEQGMKSVPWKIFYVIIFNIPMASILNDSSLGISDTLSSAITALFGADINTTLFIFIMTVLIVVCTTFIGNVTVCLMFYNIVSLFAPALGLSTTVLACIISLTSNASVILPGANPQAAMLHARRDWVETKDVAKYGAIQSAAVVATVMLAFTLFLQKVL